MFLIKRMVENVFIFPFILIGRIIAKFQPLKNDYRIFFFFPFYHTGGAEKVHVQIAAATGGEDCIIYFTKRSADARFLDEFRRSKCTIRDISEFTDNKWLYILNLVYRGIVTGYINHQHQKPTIFNGQCNFGYKISPWVRNDIPQIELIHSLNSFSYIRIPFLPFITKTVMISKKRIGDHKELYDHYKIPSHFLDKISYIPNAITLPADTRGKDNNSFTILYSGRATMEKRVHLVAEIAEKLHAGNENVNFEIAGDTAGTIHEKDYPFIKFYGNVDNEKKLGDIYSKAHALILTSTTEGFPMVILEAMAHGCVILSTPVGDIPYHIKQNENGFLFSSVEDSAVIIHEAIDRIRWIKKNADDRQRIGMNNVTYARQHFGIERFNKDYRELFLSVNKQ